MFKFLKDRFTKIRLSLLRLGANGAAARQTPGENGDDNPGNEAMRSSKIWTKEYNPLRQIVLWGWDSSHNPGFLILYGRHNFIKSKDHKTDRSCNLLDDVVKYTGYAVFRGRGGHLPSFESVKIIDDSSGYCGKKTPPAMYYKKGLKGWSKDSNFIFKEYQNFSPENQLAFAYFVPQSHNQYVQEIAKRKISFSGFTLVKNPLEILKLDEQFADYSGIITEMLSHPNLYIRKKRLNELLARNPPQELLRLLLKIGSTEWVSGLFLELAIKGMPSLLVEAKDLVESDLTWAAESYAKGVKRCARLYLNALTVELKDARANWIRKYVNLMDLPLIRINGKELPEDKVIDGGAYRNYANSGLLGDYYSRYDAQQRRYVRYEAPARYQAGPYTDGKKLKIIDFKNTIQEAEIFGLADVIGKIAYYLDAPRLTYYFQGSGKSKALSYFQRYLRRIIDHYAQNNPDQFMEAMKHLLTSYTPHDYVCKFRGNFQFNFFLKYYLYHDFKETPPTGTGWENWYARREWVSNDQLMRLQGRYEMLKEVWDRRLDIVAEIAVGSQINQIVKACYYILKDSPNSNEFIANIQYKQLVDLALVAYQPLAEMFGNILRNKIKQLNQFDPELMLVLINCADDKLCQLAMDFFKKTNGVFPAATIAELLLLDHPDHWVELFRHNLLNLEGDQYGDFIKHIINRKKEFLASNLELPEKIRDTLVHSTNQIKQVAKTVRLELLSELLTLLQQEQKMPDWLGTFIENLIFALDNDLDALMAEITIKPMEGPISARNKRIFCILEMIRSQKLPADLQIIDILENGSQKSMKMLLRIFAESGAELKERPSTLLIMLESGVTALNRQAEELFDILSPEKQRKLHAVIIDSPVHWVYSFGLKKLDLLYGENLPAEFIVQMLEHSSNDVKEYISGKINKIINDLGAQNKNLFLYYAKTLLLLPNKISKSKDRVYEVIPKFARIYQDQLNEIESMLLDVGGSNIILDSERALVTLAKIKREVMTLEG
jgi:hypothetical protein